MKNEISTEMNLKRIIVESREVAQALNEFAENIERIENKYGDKQAESEDEVEPLTDIEQRIFLAAMSREENACKEVNADGSEGGVNLVAVCHRIKRKVKKALWG